MIFSRVYLIFFVYNYQIIQEYGNESTKDQTDCTSGKTYDEEFLKGKSCKFDYKQIFKTTNCTDENQYNYKNPSPCVLIKLNKVGIHCLAKIINLFKYFQDCQLGSRI